ncbi:MAG: hypothetical protein V4723_07115 [Pseudomonadota bacterium]
MLNRVLILLFCLACAAPVWPQAEIAPEARQRDHEVAASLSELTTLAVNPVLVGGYRSVRSYYNTAPEQRHTLPWTAQPWFWGTLLTIGFIFTVNGLIGWGPLKKFLHATEVLEQKAMLIYASPLVIPVGIELIRAMGLAGISVSPLSSAHAATGMVVGSTDPVTNILGGLVGMTVFGLMWLTNQAINTLVLLSPVGLIDSAARFVQLGLLGMFLGIAALSPVLGAVISVILIIVSALIVGWSFRLTLFGTVFAWDLLGHRTRAPADASVLAFSGAGMPLPARTMGQLRRRDGRLEMVYRPWLILPRRRVSVPEHGRILTHGYIFSQIHSVSPRRDVALFTLPPRYRGSEEAVAAFTGCESSRASLLKGGVLATIKWLRAFGSSDARATLQH